MLFEPTSRFMNAREITYRFLDIEGDLISKISGPPEKTIGNFNRDANSPEERKERENNLKDQALMALASLVAGGKNNDLVLESYKNIDSVNLTANVRINAGHKNEVSRKVTLTEIFAHARKDETRQSFGKQIEEIAQVFPDIHVSPSRTAFMGNRPRGGTTYSP